MNSVGPNKVNVSGYTPSGTRQLLERKQVIIFNHPQKPIKKGTRLKPGIKGVLSN